MLFGRKKVSSAINVAFYKEAAHHVRSGLIRVSSRTLGLKNIEVAFSLVDESTLPEITPQLISDIFDAAKVQGYVPHGITNYSLGEVVAPGIQADNGLIYGGRMGMDLAEDLPGVLGGQDRSFPRGVPELGNKSEARKPFEPTVNGDLKAQPDSVPGRGYNYDVNNIVFKGKKIKSIWVAGESPKFFKTDVFEAGVVDRAFYDLYIEKTSDYWTMSQLYIELMDLYNDAGSPLITEEMASVMFDFLVAIQAPPTIGLRESATIISWTSKFARRKPAILQEASNPAQLIKDAVPTRTVATGYVDWRKHKVDYHVNSVTSPGYSLFDIMTATGADTSDVGTNSFHTADWLASCIAIACSLDQAYNPMLTAKAAFLKEIAINDLPAEQRLTAFANIETLEALGSVDFNIIDNEANDERFALAP